MKAIPNPCVGILAAALLALGSASAQIAPVDRTAPAQLETLQATLQTALDSMKKATTANKGGYVEKGIADLQLTIAEVSKSRDYLLAHPEANLLPASQSPKTEAVSRLLSAVQPNGTRAPNLRVALDHIQAAFDQLQKCPVAISAAIAIWSSPAWGRPRPTSWPASNLSRHRHRALH